MNPIPQWVIRAREKFDAERRAQELKDRADRSQAGTDAAKVARRKAEEAQRNLERMKQMREEISRDKVKRAASRIVDAAKKAKARKQSLVKSKVGKEDPEKGKTTQINMDPVLKFKEFLSEETRENIKVDSKYLATNKNRLNAELDKLTERPYQNAPIFLSQLRGFFERYTMILPASTTKNFMNLEAELVYALGDTEDFLYIVYDTNDDGFVDGYAQIVSADELSDLMDMDREELLGSDRESVEIRHSDWYRKRDDDAGNSDEY